MKKLTSTEIVENLSAQAERLIRSAFSSGFQKGYGKARKELSNIHSMGKTIHLEEQELLKLKKNLPKNYPELNLRGWCSVCGKLVEGRYSALYDFCPMCGAGLLRRGEKENDS